MPHITHSPFLAVPDPLCLSKEVVQLQRQVIGLEADRKQLLTENALLRVRLRLYSSPISLKEPSHSVLKRKKELKQFSKCLYDSQSGSKAAPSTPSLDVIPALDERFDLLRTQQAPFENLAVQYDLLNKALSDIDILAHSLIKLERTLQYQQSFSQQLLIELLFMRKQVRTLHVENQAKSNLLRLVSATHSQTKKLTKASYEEVTRQLLVQLLAFRKDIINRQLLMPSSDTSTITHEITELGILRLSEAELRAEKESLVISLKELLDVIAFRNPFSRSQGQEQENPPIMELVLALVYAWKSSQQRSIIRPQIEAATSRDFVHADGTFSRSCVSSSRYKPPHRRDVESKTQRPPITAKPSFHCKQAKKNSNMASTGASSILRVDASSFAHVKFVPVRPRKAVESSGFSSSVVGSTYLRWKTFS